MLEQNTKSSIEISRDSAHTIELASVARGGEETSGGVLKSPRFFISSLHSSNAAAAPGFSVYNTQQHIMRRTDMVLYDISAFATKY